MADGLRVPLADPLSSYGKGHEEISSAFVCVLRA